jgi:hypothetical protein
VSEEALAKHLATSVGAPQPRTEQTVAVWVALARAMQEQLIERPQPRMEDVEAGHYPVSQAFSDLGPDASELWLEALGDEEMDAVHEFIMSKVAPKLAKAGYFQLI